MDEKLLPDQKDVDPLCLDSGSANRKSIDLVSADGTRLHGYEWECKDARAVVCFVHGFASHAARAKLLAEHLSLHNNIVVVAVSYRGHGRSGGTRGHIKEFSDLYADVTAQIEYIKANYPKLPMIMVGHSQGGLLTTRYLEDMSSSKAQPTDNLLKAKTVLPHRVKGVVLSSPFFGFGAEEPSACLICMATLMSFCCPALQIPVPDLSSEISCDPAVVKDYKEDPLVFKTGTLKWGLLIPNEHQYALERAPRFKFPLLHLQGGADHVVSVEASARVHAAFGSPDKTYIEYPGLKHEIFNERAADRQKVFANVVEFIDRLLGDQ